MLHARLETSEALELFDERGASVGRVTLPTDTLVFGPDKGTVYLNRTPPFPTAPKDPARAA